MSEREKFHTEELVVVMSHYDIGFIQAIREFPRGSRRAPKLRITSDMAAPGYVVISETAWHGWRAYLDGRRVKLLRANQAFLAVYVPQGHHEVRLRYLPQSFVVGRTISVAAALLLAVALLIRQVV